MKRLMILILATLLFAAIVIAVPSDDSYPWAGKWNMSTGGGAGGINTKVTVLNTGTHNCRCASNIPLISESDGGWVDVTSQMDFKYDLCEQCNTSNCFDLSSLPGCSNCSMYTGTCFNQLPAQCTVKCMPFGIDHCTNNNNGYNTTGTSCKTDLATGKEAWMNTTNATAIGCYEGGKNATVGESQTTFGLFILDCPGIDYPPNVTLISPSNSYIWTSGYYVTFVYNVSDKYSITNCSLIINNTITLTNTTIINNQFNNMTVQLDNGDYSWSVNCTDNAAQVGASETWLLHVDVPNSAPSITSATTDNSDGSTPVNIGHNVIFTVTATDVDLDEYYLVVCNSEIISQEGVCGGTKLCNSSYAVSGAAASCSYNTSNDASRINPWWSFVCDGENCSAYNNASSPYYVNHYPAYTLIPNMSWPEDTANNSLNLTAYFNDPDGDDLNYTSTIPDNITVAIDNNTGIVTLTPKANFSGVEIIVFTAIDPYGLYNTSNAVLLNVTSVNDAPYLASVSLNISTGSYGTSVRVTSSGAGDVDNAVYFLQCGNASGDYNLCVGSPGSGQVSCNFIAPWIDDAPHNVFCVVNDTLAVSFEKSTTFTADNTPPGASTVNNLEGDTTAPYWDTDNDGHTILQANLDETGMKCRWNDSDLNYSALTSANECSVVGTVATCELNVTVQVNQTTRHVSCQDQYGNDQSITQNLDVIFGVDWTKPSVNSDNDGQIHLPGYTVTLTINDQPAGTIVTAKYCNDSSGSCAPGMQWIGTNGSTLPITFSDRGIWYLRWNASDAAGNVNETKQTIVYINTLPLFGPQTYTNMPAHRFAVNATVYDAVGAAQGGSFSCKLYHRKNPAAFTSKDMVLQSGTATNGVYYANISTLDGYAVADVVDTYVNCSDGMEWNISNPGSNAIPNYAPGAPTVQIVPSNPTTADDLFCNITVNSTDIDSDAVIYYYEWSKDGAKQGISNPLLKSGNLSFNDKWNCTVTPYDSYVNGTPGSYAVTVGASAPTFNMSNPIANMSWPEDVTNSSLNLSRHFYDLDGDPLIFNYTPILNITVQINQATGIVTFIPDANFYGVRYIRFNATDGSFWSDYSNNVMLNVTPVNDAPYLTSISLNVSVGKAGTSVRATSSGAGDIDSSSWRLQCGNETGKYNLCAGSLGTGERTCDFIAPWTNNGANNVYCVINDSSDISAERTAIFTSDNSGPLWSNNKTYPASPAEYMPGANYQFNVSWTDTAGVQGAVIEHNFTGVLQNASMSNSGSEYYFNYNNLGAGSYVWRSYANDNFGNRNMTVQWNYIVHDTTKPNITLITPLTNDILGWAVMIRANVTDPYLANVWYEIRNGTASSPVLASGAMNPIGGGIFNSTLYTNETWPYDGLLFNSTNLTLIVYANDTSGNVKNASSSWFLDNSKPSIQYINPSQNGNFFNSNFNLNIFLANHKLGYSNYTIFNTTHTIQTNQTNLASATFSWTDFVNIANLADGNYTIYVYTADSSSPANTNNKTTWFYVKKTLPSPMVWAAPTPGNNSYTNVQTQIFNMSCDTAFLDRVWINFNGTINNTPSGSSGNYYWWIFTGLEGTYRYTGYCNDSASNQQQTEQRTVNVDTVMPVWSGNKTSAPSGAVYGSGPYQFNITALDNYGVGIVSFENNFSGILSNYTPTGSSGSTYFYNTGILAAGSYVWRVYITDFAGNVNMTTQWTFAVSKANSALILLLDGNAQNLTVETGSIVNISAYRIAGEGLIYLYDNSNQINSGVSLTNLTLYNSTGYHNITAVYPTTQNYTESLATLFVNVTDTKAPNITTITTSIALPLYNNGSQQIINVSFASSEYPINVTFELYNLTGGIVNITGPIQINNAGELPIQYILSAGYADGNYTLNMTIEDSAGNEQDYTVGTIVVDKTAPVLTLINTTPSSPVLNNGAQQNILVNFTSSEYPVYIVFDLYNSAGGTVHTFGPVVVNNSGELPIQYTVPAGLAEGNYALNITVEDLAGNYREYNAANVTVDLSPPNVTGAMTAPGAINQGQFTNITVSVTDIGGISAVVARIAETNGSVNNYPMIHGAVNIWYFTYNVPQNMPAGQFNVTIIANDTLGHVNNSVTTSFNVNDISAPRVAINSPIPGQIVGYGNPVAISVNASDETQIGAVIANVSIGAFYTLITLTDPDFDRIFTGTFTNTTAIGTYTIRMLVNDSAGNLNNSVTTTFVIQDMNNPVITNTTIRPRVQMAGEPVFLNATATDDVAVSAVWADITLPNSSVVRKYLSAGDNNYTLNITGRHNVTFFANDTSGRTVNTTGFFISAWPIYFNFSAFDFSIMGVNATVRLYYPNTSELVYEFTAPGPVTLKLANYTYDVQIIISFFNVDLFFKYVDLQLNNPFILGVDRLATPVPSFLITYGLNGSYNGIQGINVTLGYNGTGYGNENKLEAYKCNNWNFTGQVCLATWDLVEHILDTAGKTVTVNVTSFSGFSIKQGAYCGDGVCGAGESCSTCAADCGTCAAGGGGGGTSPPKQVYSEIPEEIYVGEETVLSFYYLDAYNLKAGLKNAEIKIYKWGTDELVASGFTDENGNFVFVAPHTGRFRVEVRARGVTSLTEAFTSKPFPTPVAVGKLTAPGLVSPATLIQTIVKPLVIIITVFFALFLVFLIIRPYMLAWFIKRAEARRLLMSRKRAYDLAERLMNFIERAAWQGYKKHQIKEMLLSKGWSKKTVDEYVDYVWQEYKKY